MQSHQRHTSVRKLTVLSSGITKQEGMNTKALKPQFRSYKVEHNKLGIRQDEADKYKDKNY